ncbi:MAG: short-chain dehydrogenase [Hyphomonas sp.]|uniref:SDR family oxidoreductase n=1 Tax=Hyphomonas sp. TaxID=87 RepID=UPI0025C3148C|nr:SDR family oxidoreductase [Hyphomonas sp.]MBA4338252.1 short-chain dehydrogenase [Hyphomonas sp.]
MPTTLITGANRGIGLALVREFQSKGHTVIATARDLAAAKDLKATGAELHTLDVSDAASIKALAEALKGRPIDFLINNAGLGDRADISRLDYDRFEEILRVNTIAPIRVLDALTPNLAAGKEKIAAALSSQLGSIENTDMGFGLAYRVSKAGLNMGLRTAAHTLSAQGITLLALHPGWVKTDMGGDGAPVEPADSAAGLYKVITGAGPSKELRFYDFEGKTLPW